MEEENIYPIFDRMLSRKDKEELRGQRGVMPVSYTHLHYRYCKQEYADWGLFLL